MAKCKHKSPAFFEVTEDGYGGWQLGEVGRHVVTAVKYCPWCGQKL